LFTIRIFFGGFKRRRILRRFQKSNLSFRKMHLTKIIPKKQALWLKNEIKKTSIFQITFFAKFYLDFKNITYLSRKSR
jgi:hypothetical protein